MALVLLVLCGALLAAQCGCRGRETTAAVTVSARDENPPASAGAPKHDEAVPARPLDEVGQLLDEAEKEANGAQIQDALETALKILLRVEAAAKDKHESTPLAERSWRLARLASRARIHAVARDALRLNLRALEESPSYDEHRRRAHLRLAAASLLLRDLAAAQRQAELVLARWADELPAGHEHVGEARSLLGMVHLMRGESNEARDLLRRVVTDATATEGPLRPHVKRAHTLLREFYARQGKPRLALESQVALAEDLARSRADDDPELLSAQVRIAQFLLELGEYPHAVELLEKVREPVLRRYGKDHDESVFVESYRAVALANSGFPKRAREIEEALIERLEKKLPREDWRLLKLRSNLAMTLRQLGESQACLDLLEEVDEILARTRDENSPEVEQLRQRMALALKDVGKVKEATRLEEQVLDARSRRLPPEHQDLQAARLNLAATLKELGNFRRAEKLEREVLQHHRDAPPDSEHVLTAKGHLADTLRELGQLEEARALQREILEVRMRKLTPGEPRRLKALQNLAAVLRDFDKPQAALGLAKQALDEANERFPAEHDLVLEAKEHYGVALQDTGRLSEARATYEEILSARERSLPSDHARLQRTRGGLATVLQDLGEHHRARDLLEDVLAVRVRTLPERHTDLQLTRMNLGNSLRFLGNLERARELHTQALETLETVLGDDADWVQAARLNLAATLKDLGDFDAALPLEEEVLEVQTRTLADDHRSLQVIRNNLALTLQELGRPQEARMLLEAIVKSLEKRSAPAVVELLLARLNLAQAMIEARDFVAARTVLEKATAEAVGLDSDHQFLLLARFNLASVDFCEGDLRKAFDTAQEVYRTLRSADTAHARSQVLGDFLWMAVAAREDQTARKLAAGLAHNAWADVQQQGSLLSPRELESLALARQEDVSETLSVAAGSSGLAPDPRLDRAAFASLESLRAVAARISRHLHVFAAQAEDAELLDALRSAEGNSKEIAQLVAGVLRGQDAAVEFIARLTRERDKALSSARARLRTLVKRDGLPELTVERVAQALGSERAAVSYRFYRHTQLESRSPPRFRSENRLTAFVVLPGGDFRRIDLCTREELGRALRPDDGPEGKPASPLIRRREDPARHVNVRVRELVFDPLREMLGSAREVVVVPDGPLHLLPLDALPDGAGLLGERYHFEVRNTLAELVENGATARAVSPNLLLFAEVDYSTRAPGGALAPLVESERHSRSAFRSAPLPQRGTAAEQRAFAPLPATAEEAGRVAETFQSAFANAATLVRGATATAEVFRMLAPGKRYLHVATHGYFARTPSASPRPEPPGGPLDFGQLVTIREFVRRISPSALCGLAFAGANQGVDQRRRVSGVLTAEELSQLDLSQCELAVLSACETHVGAERAGQGLASLQAALYAAGARSSITSLWKVDDRAARELMVEFYDRLWRRGETKAEALWQAKIALRDRGFPRRNWAGWVLVGDPR